MYLVGVLGLTVVLPVVSILLDTALSGSAITLSLVGKWFVLWAVLSR
jgi:hypothetical protein